MPRGSRSQKRMHPGLIPVEEGQEMETLLGLVHFAQAEMVAFGR